MRMRARIRQEHGRGTCVITVDGLAQHALAGGSTGGKEASEAEHVRAT